MNNLSVDLKNGLTSTSNLYNNFGYEFARDNPIILITFTIVIVGYFLFFGFLNVGGSKDVVSEGLDKMTSLASSTSKKSSYGISFLTILIVALFLFLIIIQGVQYLFSMDITTVIKNIFTPQAEIDINIVREEDKSTTIPEIKFEKQVFNIPENIYSYDDAKALCKAYGAELANYEQIEDTYNKGGEWCNYGWSDNQMILYPTQKNTYDILQQIEGHEHDCGRPGVNGGFISNPNAKFGVNCYGYKPEINTNEAEYMKYQKLYPITKKDKEINEKINTYKSKLKDILVSPFNPKQWSII